MHTAKTMNVAVIYDGAALDFSEVYKKYFSRVKQRLVQLDNKSGFTRTNDQIEDLTQTFFTKVWANNILNSFDPNKLLGTDKLGISPYGTTLTVVIRKNDSTNISSKKGF